MAVDATQVALIPARGGSRGLPRKNIRPFEGRPLIAWSIAHALGAPSVSRVVVSTDDPEIAAIAREYGAEVPFMRPPALATDDARSIDVVLHALDRLEEDGIVDTLIVLQPTSPLRTTDDVEGALGRLRSLRADAIVSVTEVGFPLELANTLPADGCMSAFLRPGIQDLRRQDLPTWYRLNGALYAGRPDSIRERRGFYGPRTYAWVMPPERSVDVDHARDLDLAAFHHRNQSLAGALT
jgi:CMP-N,N'-diacetyllegionaminic acid synthase